MIFWFTGQAGHGKTTLAKKLKHFFESSGCNKVFHIDGDDLRSLTGNKDFSEEGRRKNILLAQNIAHFLHNNNYTVIVSLVAPFRDIREKFKSDTGCKEILVHTREIRGREHFHVEYESPLEDFLSIDTTNLTPDDSLNLIIEHFKLE